MRIGSRTSRTHHPRGPVRITAARDNSQHQPEKAPNEKLIEAEFRVVVDSSTLLMLGKEVGHRHVRNSSRDYRHALTFSLRYSTWP